MVKLGPIFLKWRRGLFVTQSGNFAYTNLRMGLLTCNIVSTFRKFNGRESLHRQGRALIRSKGLWLYRVFNFLKPHGNEPTFSFFAIDWLLALSKFLVVSHDSIRGYV